jgi:hypothetical protein
MIKYQEIRGYKYRLLETYSIQTDIHPVYPIETNWLELTRDGFLTIRAGYCWDGASGPTWDDKSSMRGSLVHDAFYQLIRLGMLPVSPNKAKADAIMHHMCLEDKMNPARAWAWLKALTLFGSKRTRPMPGDIPQVMEAP